MSNLIKKPSMSKDAKTISLRHWLDYVESIHNQSVDFDLSRAAEVAQKGHFAELSIPVITVAGTNGKGSTTALLTKALGACGLKVGCYLSPHLHFFNERIILKGKPAQEHLICQAFAKVEKARGQVSLTYFEFTTLAALELFKQAQLDVVVLEVGCGGEKDAVNLVDPTLSIITNVSLDHMGWLGQTVEEIALAKAGIMRSNKPAIIGLQAQIPTLLDKAKSLKTKLYLEGQAFGWHDKYKSYWQFNGRHIRVAPSFVPSTSISLTLAALEVLKPILPAVERFPMDRLNDIIRTSQLPGRFQRMVGVAETWFDVAHNAAGAKWLAENLKKLPPADKLIAVWSSFEDKVLADIVAPLLPLVDIWVVAQNQHERGAPLDKLVATLEQSGAKEIVEAPSLATAFKKAEKLCGPNGRMVVYGSFVTVAEVMRSHEHDYHSVNNFFSSISFGREAIES